MTMAMKASDLRASGPKVLRIGLIQAGKIVEERIIRRRETVSVGSSEKNHFVVQAPGMPGKFDLFQVVGSGYVLNFTEHMRGRVGGQGGVASLEEMRASGAARNLSNHWQLPLGDNMRGKIVMGDITLLFQFVVPPPVQPRPQLPAAATGGLAKTIDWRFTSYLLLSFMLHFGFVVYLENADWPMEEGIDTVPRSVAGMIFSEPPPPPEDVPDLPTEAEEEGEGDAEEEQQAASKGKSEGSPSEGRSAGPNAGDVATSAEARAAFAEQAAQAAEAMLLSGLGGEESGLADVVAQGAVTGNAEDILAQAAGVGVAKGGSSGELRSRSGGGGGSKGLGDLGSLGKSGGGGEEQSEGGAVQERQIRGDINLGSGGDVGGSGEFDASVVVGMIRKRIRAIQRCYENELRRNPTLSGKVVVEFTIQTTGSVTDAKATTNSTGDAAVASCVVQTIRRFRFNDPAPEGGSVTFSYPFVFAPQN